MGTMILDDVDDVHVGAVITIADAIEVVHYVDRRVVTISSLAIVAPAGISLTEFLDR